MANEPETMPAFEALLALTAERGWQGLAMTDIARRCHWPMAKLCQNFGSKWAILAAYFDQIDTELLQEDLADPDSSVRDRLFEALMFRFDRMAPHKEGLHAVLRSAVFDPTLWPCGLQRMMHSCGLSLEAAGISSGGLAGRIKIKGLLAVYLATMRVWLEDDSAGLEKTMAALDQGLGRLDGLAELLFRRRPLDPPS
ncbi:MAG TPA: hypothetical protein HPP80_01205 [Rhodospirillaceae bacterium]|nr:hypothetical protein [Rhodospirillaceae bacterium]